MCIHDCFSRLCRRGGLHKILQSELLHPGRAAMPEPVALGVLHDVLVCGCVVPPGSVHCVRVPVPCGRGVACLPFAPHYTFSLDFASLNETGLDLCGAPMQEGMVYLSGRKFIHRDLVSQSQIINQNGATSGFEICFAPAPLVLGSKHVSNPA